MALVPVRVAGDVAAGVLAVAVSTAAAATAEAKRPMGVAVANISPSAPHGQNGVIAPAL